MGKPKQQQTVDPSELIKLQTELNRTGEVNNLGSNGWEQGADGQWNQVQRLSPQGQALFDRTYGLATEDSMRNPLEALQGTGMEGLAQGLLNGANAWYPNQGQGGQSSSAKPPADSPQPDYPSSGGIPVNEPPPTGLGAQGGRAGAIAGGAGGEAPRYGAQQPGAGPGGGFEGGNRGARDAGWGTGFIPPSGGYRPPYQWDGNVGIGNEFTNPNPIDPNSPANWAADNGRNLGRLAGSLSPVPGGGFIGGRIGDWLGNQYYENNYGRFYSPVDPSNPVGVFGGETPTPIGDILGGITASGQIAGGPGSFGPVGSGGGGGGGRGGGGNTSASSGRGAQHGAVRSYGGPGQTGSHIKIPINDN